MIVICHLTSLCVSLCPTVNSQPASQRRDAHRRWPIAALCRRRRIVARACASGKRKRGDTRSSHDAARHERNGSDADRHTSSAARRWAISRRRRAPPPPVAASAAAPFDRASRSRPALRTLAAAGAGIIRAAARSGETRKQREGRPATARRSASPSVS